MLFYELPRQSNPVTNVIAEHPLPATANKPPDLASLLPLQFLRINRNFQSAVLARN
jgi:hypothetical protein